MSKGAAGLTSELFNFGMHRENRMEKQRIVIIAIICITLMEINALANGINGWLLNVSIATVAGLAGLITKTPKILK